MTPEAAAAVLGVSLDADRASIEAAFRRTAKRTHPDRFAGDGTARLRAAAAEFDRASRARETLLGTARPASRAASAARPAPPPPSAARSAPPPAGRAPHPTRIVNHRERAVIGIAVVALLLAIGAVLTIGLLPDSTTTTGPASSFSDPTKDPLHGLNVIQITDAKTIERQCDGHRACWLWSVASARSCPHGIVTIDFFASANDTTPTETITQDVNVTAHKPSFVTASRAGFPEPRAHISRFACNS